VESAVALGTQEAPHCASGVVVVDVQPVLLGSLSTDGTDSLLLGQLGEVPLLGDPVLAEVVLASAVLSWFSLGLEPILVGLVVGLVVGGSISAVGTLWGWCRSPLEGDTTLRSC
jgi:hypothetical protein